MFRFLIGIIAKFILAIAYAANQAEGLNTAFQFLPARFLVPTLQKNGALIGDEVEMHTPIQFHNTSETKKQHFANLHIGNQCYFGRDVFIDLADKVIIADYVTISMRVTIITHTHAGKSPLTHSRLLPSYAPVVLSEGCYIGASATILQGVEIGKNAIVAAGAVVTHNVEANTSVAGVPAKITYHNSPQRSNGDAFGDDC